jgi:hypothetical protein
MGWLWITEKFSTVHQDWNRSRWFPKFSLFIVNPFQISSGWPDWANFAHWVIVYFGAVFLKKKQKWPTFLGYYFSRLGVNFEKYGSHFIFALFHKLIWSPCISSTFESTADLSQFRVVQAQAQVLIGYLHLMRQARS